MKRRGLWSVLLLAVSCALLSGCQKAAENTNSVAPAASPTAEKVDTAAIEKELFQMERDWVAATTNRDVAAVSKIEADDILMTYPDGSTGTKVDELKGVQDGAISAESWDMPEAKVTVLDANAAMVTGRQVVKNGKLKDPKGRILDISGEYRFTDVFARRDGKWQAVASQLTLVAPGSKPSPTPIASSTASPAAGASPGVSTSPARRPLPPITPATGSPAPKPTQ